MTAVDLIPQEMKLSQVRCRRLRFWLIVILLTVTFSGVWAGVKYLGYRKYTRMSRDTAQKQGDIQLEIQKLTQAKDELDSWQSRIVVLDELGRYPDFVGMFDYLSSRSPQLLYLDEIKITQLDSDGKGAGASLKLPDGAAMFELKNMAGSAAANGAGTIPRRPNIMRLKGQAVNYQAVADFLNILKASRFCRYTQLKHTSRVKFDERQTIAFEIECVLISIPNNTGIDYADKHETKNF